MKPYSLDLREHVVQAVNRGIPMAKVARVFGVGYSTVKRYTKQQSETGRLTPKLIPGRPPVKGEILRQALEAQFEAHPQATLEQHCRIFQAEEHINVSQSTMARTIKQLGWTYKKKILRASERNEEECESWKIRVQRIDPNRLVFVDECSISIAMTTLYARSPKGKRAVGSVPRKRGPNITLIASLSLNGINAPMTLEDAADSLAFEMYVQHILVPTLQPEQIVVLDNYTIHKSEIVREAIEKSECKLLFLPPYSEGLSPIDEAFSKIKEYLRRSQARTRDALDNAIAQAIARVTPEDAHGWFKHCGCMRCE